MEVIGDYPHLAKLAEDDSLMVDGVLWSKIDGKVYMESSLVVPMAFVKEFARFMHQRLGHPSFQRMLHFWDLRYVSAQVEETKSLLRQICEECGICTLGKGNRPKDRGVMGSLPIPMLVNQEVAIDIIFLASDMKGLFMMDTLSKFTQVCLLMESTQEGVARTFWEEWISKFGAPGRITADNDVRWSPPMAYGVA